MKKNQFSNHEIVTLAAYLLGGDVRHVDTEDVAFKASELAPGRFAWRKYPDQINLEIIRVYLSDAKKLAKGGYLIRSGADGWLLTEKGVRFAKDQLLFDPCAREVTASIGDACLVEQFTEASAIPTESQTHCIPGPHT